jgi:plastocyanin domain-containing protein
MNFSCFMCNNLPLLLLLSVAALGFAAWYFFFRHRSKPQPLHGPAVTIKVENGYHPNTITIEKGKTTRFNLIRTDPNPSLEEIVLPDFNIRRHLPLNHKVGFEITPYHTGEFTFSSGFNDFHGKIIVK